MTIKETILEAYLQHSKNRTEDVKKDFCNKFGFGKNYVEVTSGYADTYSIKIEDILITGYNVGGDVSYYYGKDSWGYMINNLMNLGRAIYLEKYYKKIWGKK